MRRTATGGGYHRRFMDFDVEWRLFGAAEKSKIIFIWQKKTTVLIYVRKYKRRLTVQSRQQLESIKIISV
jgi:hypothetical protein